MPLCTQRLPSPEQTMSDKFGPKRPGFMMIRPCQKILQLGVFLLFHARISLY